MMAEKKDSGIFSIPDVSNIDIGKVGSVYGMQKQKDSQEPEYLEFSKKGRDIFGKLNFNTGVSWASAFMIAGTYGLVEGWRGAASNNFRVKFNSVLNGISKRGNKAANLCGVLAFMHTTFTYGAESYDADRAMKTELGTPIIAGALTGLLYTSTRTINVVAYGVVIGSVASVAYYYAHLHVYDYIMSRRYRRRHF